MMIPFIILAIESEQDRNFMSELYLKYEKLMYSEIMKILHNEWDAEDVMQSTLIKLIDKISELQEKEPAKLVNYIITACKNNSINYLRDHRKWETGILDDYLEVADEENDGTCFELKLIAEEEIEALVHLWPRLDERSRQLLEGRYILNKKDEELAKELRIKPGSVRMALTRARKNAYQLLDRSAV